MYPNVENMTIVPNHTKNGDYYKNQTLTNFTDDYGLQGKCWNEKLFMQIQSINTMYHNMENMAVVPNDKKNADYYQNPSLTHLTNKLCLQGKPWKEKLFLQI